MPGYFCLSAGLGIVIANDQTDGLHATADGSLGAFGHNLVRGHGNGLQSGRAESGSP